MLALLGTLAFLNTYVNKWNQSKNELSASYARILKFGEQGDYYCRRLNVTH
jgi:hypothetical protein